MKKLVVWAVILGTGFYFGSKFYLHYRVSSNVDDLLLMLSPFAQVSYSGVSSTMGGTLSIDDIHIQVNGYRDPISADKLSLVTPGFWHLLSLNDVGRNMVASEMPDSLGFAIIGFSSQLDSDLVEAMYELGGKKDIGEDELDAAAECTGKFGYSPQDLQALGYKTLSADMHVGYRKEADNMIVDVRTSLAEMYDMDIEMTLDGHVSPQSVAVGAYRPKLVDARLVYVDQSLDQRTTHLCERAGLSAEELVAAKLDAFMAIGKQNGIEFDDQVVEPYKQFLAGKSTFVMTAKPHEPVTMSQIGLYKPSDVPALLNLTATAE